MRHTLKDENTGGELLLFKDEAGFDRLVFSKDQFNKYFTIVWNTAESQTIFIDGAEYNFPENSLITLLHNQSFSFGDSTGIVAWQFNREFYCIIDNDSEVGCVGFLFSNIYHLIIELNDQAQQKLQLLSAVFIEEFKTSDNVQNELLVALLKRLIIYITQLAKVGYVPAKKLQDNRFHIIRKFNLLVEKNFKSEHSVGFYAEKLCKAPKTLSNLFALFNLKPPSQIIQDRIIVEAKRLLRFTDRSVKEISFELGFEDVAYFSNFFKKNAGISPSDFRNPLKDSN